MKVKGGWQRTGLPLCTITEAVLPTRLAATLAGKEKAELSLGGLTQVLG